MVAAGKGLRRARDRFPSRDGRGDLATHIAGAALAAVTIALALLDGGIASRYWIPVAVLAVLVTAVQAVRCELPALRSLAGLALLAGAGLVAWNAASIAWARYSQHLAWEEANRSLLYVAVAAAGASLVQRYAQLARTAAWCGGGIALLAAACCWQLLQSDDPRTLLGGARLDWPFAYSNGLAALLVTGTLLLLARACSRSIHVVDSAASMGGATLCAGVAALCQSRGSVVGAAAGILVGLALLPARGALLVRTALILGALLLAADRLNEPYALVDGLLTAAQDAGRAEVVGDADLPAVRDAFGQAAQAVLLLTVLAAGIGGILTVLERRFDREGSGATGTVRLVVVGLLLGATVIAGVMRLPVAESIDSLRDQAQVIAGEQQADAGGSAGGSHFTDVNPTNRADFWRVAVATMRDEPVLGIGANNFAGEYVRQRTSSEQPATAHSMAFQLLADTGLVGAALFALVVMCVAGAAWAYAGVGPERNTAAGGVAMVAVSWIQHASLDWLWHIPAVTVPVAFLVGGLLSCAARERNWQRHSLTIVLAVAVGVIALGSLVPQVIADRAVAASRSESDTTQALRLTRRAARWDRTWAEPVVREAELLQKSGGPGVQAAAQAAVAREPESWVVRLRAARVLARLRDPGARADAREHVREARRLNPRLGNLASG